MNYDNSWGSDDNDGQQETGIRQYIKSLEGKIQALEEERKTEKANASKAVREATFKSLNIKPSVASMYNGADNPDAIESWVNDMRETFGSPAPEQQGNVQQQTQPALTPSEQNQYQRMTDAGQNQGSTSTMDDVQARLAQATSTDELHKIWQSMS